MSAVSAGYKLTEVGVIPSDWSLVVLEDITKDSLQNGLFFEPSRKGVGVKLINVSDLFQSRRINSDVLELFNATELEVKNFGVDSGDIFFTRSSLVPSGIAHCNIYQEGNLEQVVFDSHVIRLKPNRQKILPSYLNKFCLGALARQYLIANAKTGSMTTIDQKVLSRCPVLLPPLAEQQAIDQALSDADAYIESLEQLLAKKRNIKQGAMQELLTGKRRLEGFSGEWVVQRLDALADIRSGGTPSTTQSELWNGSVLWCTPTDITALKGNKFLFDTSKKITKLGLESSSAELIPANSIVMTTRATIGECAINQVEVSTNQGFKNFIPFDNVSVDFLYYLLGTQKQGFISLCGGSTFLEIGKTQLRAYEVTMPPSVDEQTAIATILSDMDAELDALQAKLNKAFALKQGMMQQLLTGKIRLV